MFGAPIIRITHPRGPLDTSSEEEDEVSPPAIYDVFISRLILVFKSDEDPPTTSSRVLNGLQLKPFTDSRGRFFIGHIHKYYPTLDTILLKYIKIPVVDSDMPILTRQQEKEETVERVIDVAKRYDIRNSISCKFGVNF